MIQFELFGMLIEGAITAFEIYIGSITYPVGDLFRKDNLFCLLNMQGEWYLEILSFVIIGEKV